MVSLVNFPPFFSFRKSSQLSPRNDYVLVIVVREGKVS